MTEEEKLDFFQLKQKVLGEFPHPKLIAKYANQAAKKVGISNFSFVKPVFNRHDVPIIHYLENQLNDALDLKKRIAQAQDYRLLNNLLIELYALQYSLFQQLKSYLPSEVNFDDEHLKISLSIDVYRLISLIRERNLNENEIKPYLYKRIVTKEWDSDELTEIFLRANKIVEHA